MYVTHPREESVYHEARRLAKPEDRDAYLREACADDPALRDRVAALLRVGDEAACVFGDHPFAAPEVPARAAERPGTRVGPYRLLEPIGEGGMGVVYVAEQSAPVRRRVALKVIKPGMDSHQVVARFEAERQALALMDHPNIARVFDAGTTDSGRPYFVMELVGGVPVTEYCDREKLGVRERVALFVQVCRAVQHAHQKGVIHRDLKPSNVLVAVVDGAPVPKVIDFGVAKATGPRLTDRTLYTAFAQVVGTPLYMSPEQAQLGGLDVDTRTDIYSLGVLLYELLTGTTPVDRETVRRAALDEVFRAVREDEPPRPSTRLSSFDAAGRSAVSANRGTDPRRLRRSVGGELDWVVMKALEKNRSRRYDTANGLAADLSRFLDGRPVEAGPPSPWYRLTRTARRHRASLATAGLVALALVAGTAVSAWQAARARGAAAEARAREAESRQVVDFLVNDLFGAGTPGGAHDRSMSVGELFDRADAAVTERFRGQPLVEASVRLALARSYHNFGDGRRAAPHAARAADLRAGALGPEHPLTLQARMQYARELGFSQQFAPAEPIVRELLAVNERRLGPAHPETIEDRTFLSYLLFKLGRLEEAERLLTAGEVLALRHLGPLHPQTLFVWDILGQVLAARGELDRGAAMLRQANAGRERTIGPLDESVLWCLQNLAEIERLRGRPDEARRILVDLVDRNARVYGLAHSNSSPSLGGLLALLRQQGDFQAVRDTLQGWLRTLLAVPRETDPDRRRTRSVRLAYHALGLALLPEGVAYDGDLALRAAAAAADLDDNWDDAWTVVGVVNYRLGRLDAAEDALRKSMTRPRWQGGDDFDWLVLALIHARRGRPAEARAWYDRARTRKNPVDFHRVDLKPLRDEAEALLSANFPPTPS